MRRPSCRADWTRPCLMFVRYGQRPGPGGIQSGTDSRRVQSGGLGRDMVAAVLVIGLHAMGGDRQCQ